MDLHTNSLQFMKLKLVVVFPLLSTLNSYKFSLKQITSIYVKLKVHLYFLPLFPVIPPPCILCIIDQSSILRNIYIYFFNYYLAAPRPTSGHYRGDSLTHPMLITAFVHVRPEGHREPRSEVGSLSPAERLAGFEPGTFRFL